MSGSAFCSVATGHHFFGIFILVLGRVTYSTCRLIAFSRVCRQGYCNLDLFCTVHETESELFGGGDSVCVCVGGSGGVDVRA